MFNSLIMPEKKNLLNLICYLCSDIANVLHLISYRFIVCKTSCFLFKCFWNLAMFYLCSIFVLSAYLLPHLFLFVFLFRYLFIMHVFSCPCLNIQIHARGATPLLRDVTYPHFAKMIGTDSFFLPNAFVITLDLGGVTKVSCFVLIFLNFRYSHIM